VADRAAAAAGLLYGSSAAVLLVARSWQQKRATGSSGFRGFTGMRSGRADRVGGLCFGVAVAAGLASPVLAALNRLPVAKEPPSLVWAGAAVATGGVVLASLAQQTMGESWRIGVDPTEQTALVTDGVFALARNPIFTAMTMVQAGTAAMSPTALAGVGLAAMVLACQVQTRLVEEPYLLRTHGDTYAGYAGRTGRFVPGLGRLSTSGQEWPRSAADRA
jgi:protein-S-isoprenylcysteine O-methyltransferase Ste14